MDNNNLDIIIRFLIDQAAKGNLSKGVDEIEKELGELEKAYEKTARKAEQLQKLSAVLQKVGGALFIGGVGIIGTMFEQANKYVRNAKEATDVTERWKKAQERLALPMQKIGASIAETLLPTLEKAAELAEKAAAYVEKHPEIIKAGLVAGTVMAGMGAIIAGIGTAGMIASIRMFDTAVNKFIAGAAALSGDLGKSSMLKGFGGGISTASLATFGQFLLTGIGSLLAGGFIGDKLGEAIARKINPADTADYSAKDYLTEFKQLLAITAFRFDQLFNTGGKFFTKVRDALFKVEEQADDTAGSLDRLAGSMNEEQIVKAFQQWREEDARLVAEAGEKRLQIVQSYQQKEANATRDYLNRVSQINSSLNAQAGQIMTRFAEDMKKAEADYTRDRAEIIADSSEEIQRIEEDHQERMRKLTEDHQERVADLVSKRDALGLVKEERRFARERAEAERGVNQAIARERQETAERLRELAERYARERAQRQEQYQQDLAENSAQRAAQLEEARKAHFEQMKQLREAKQNELKELDQNLQAERKRRRDQFIATVRDLDSALLGERTLKNQYYDLMLQDAERFLQQWRAGIQDAGTTTTTTTSPTSGTSAFADWASQFGFGNKDTGGYADKGIYSLAWDGNREFVMSGNTTRAAERALGGNLTQDRIMSALMMGGNGSSVNYTDNRRMPSQGPIDREALREDMRALLREEMKYAFR
jgi:hypothetical protein